MKRTTERAGISIKPATVNYAQTIGMIERTHQKLKTILKININVDQPEWDQYVNMAVIAHNTSYQKQTDIVDHKSETLAHRQQQSWKCA